MRPLHVLHVIDGLGLGGAERMAVDLANATLRAGHRVSLVITRSPDTLAAELAPEVQVLRLGRTSRYDVAPLVDLVRRANRERVDIVHVHMRSSMALLLPFRALRILRAPVVFHDHYGTIEDDTSVPRWLRLGHRFIDRYVGVSPALGSWARGFGMSTARVEVIENAIDLARLVAPSAVDLRAELDLAPTTCLGVVVATLRPDKGIETLLDALAASAARDRIHIAVAGTRGVPAYATAMEARRDRLGLARTVTFLGGRRDVPALLHAADFAALSSHTESGPLVLIEYLHASRPVVATRVGDIGRRIAAADIPGFVPPRDPTAFAAELDRIASLSAAERAARGAAGRRLVENWNIEHVMPRWFACYERALA